MSGMTLIQGTIAAELRTYDNNAMWFSSAYLIAMSSLAPIAGRLATIFPPSPHSVRGRANSHGGLLLCRGWNIWGLSRGSSRRWNRRSWRADADRHLWTGTDD